MKIKTLRDYIKDELYCSDETLDNMLNDDFSNTNRVHNWRNYVPDHFISEWGNLSEEVKLAVFLMAESRSNREEWD
jgi:hypothetical protein